MRPQRLDLRGQKFGRLTVAERDGADGHGHVIWRCRCECGGQTFADGGNLRRGGVRSCGCSKRLPRFGGVRRVVG